MKNFKQLLEQHREKGRFKPVKPHNVPETPGAMLRKEEAEDTQEKVEMVQSQLHFIGYACDEILDFIEMGGEVEEWYQVKVAKAFSEFESLHAYIEGEKRRTGMVKEEVESLDELSKKTLANYVLKSTLTGRDPEQLRAMHDKRKFHNRFAGVHKALEKLSKEEVEQIDEISAETKAAYTLKAKQQVKELEPHAKKGEYMNLAKNLIAKRKKGLAMAEGENKEMKEKDPCWKGYEMVGMKDKGGRKVPNCVPVKEEVINEDDLPVTTKKSKTVTVKHKTSGKELNVVDTPSVREKYKTMGYHPVKEEVEQVQEAEKIQKHRPGWMARMIKRDNPEMAAKMNQGKEMNKLMHKYGGKTSDEIAKMKKEAVDVPFEGGKKAKGTVTDKSGAKHSPMSRVRDLARKAMQKQMPKQKVKESSNKAEIVKKAAKDSKEKFNPDPVLTNSVMKENK